MLASRPAPEEEDEALKEGAGGRGAQGGGWSARHDNVREVAAATLELFIVQGDLKQRKVLGN